MKNRIDEIFSIIPKSEIFADIGCDHGYIAKKMLDSGKCKKAIVSDISEKCLNKASELLKNETETKRAEAIVSDGFDALPIVDTALIAGMGGEEIIKILLNAKNAQKLPETLILQPMKNAEKVRKAIVDLQYKIEKDYLFYVKDKYYILILVKRGQDSLTEDEIEFGRTNINEPSQDFLRYIKEEIAKFSGFGNGKEVIEKIARLKKYDRH